MKRGNILILTILGLIALMLLSGCGMSAEEIVMGDDAADAEETPTAPQPTTEDLADQLVEQVAVETVPEPELNLTEENITNETVIEISGSLELQDDISLCPHLKESFSCNKYDVRWCDFRHDVGVDFLPDYMKCRDGDATKGEDPEHRFCLIQDCSPHAEENIVVYYGGTQAYGEYDFSVEKTGSGIMTHYQLLRCGEEPHEFEKKNDCTVFGAAVRLP